MMEFWKPKPFIQGLCKLSRMVVHVCCPKLGTVFLEVW